MTLAYFCILSLQLVISEDKDKVDAYNLNVAGYILKPLSMESFVSAVSILKNYWTLCEYPH